jgi:hypothetical protein
LVKSPPTISPTSQSLGSNLSFVHKSESFGLGFKKPHLAPQIEYLVAKWAFWLIGQVGKEITICKHNKFGLYVGILIGEHNEA